MTLNLLAAVDDLVATLKELEVEGTPLRVTTTVETIAPPCVWVAVDGIDHTLGAGEVTVRLFLISGDLDEYRAIGALSPMVAAVLSVISPTEDTTVAEVAPTFQTKGLPALRLTTTVLN